MKRHGPLVLAELIAKFDLARPPKKSLKNLFWEERAIPQSGRILKKNMEYDRMVER